MKYFLAVLTFILISPLNISANDGTRVKSILQIYATDVYVQTVTILSSFEHDESDASICFQVGQLDGSFSVLRMFAQEHESGLGTKLSRQAADVGQTSRSELRALSNRLCISGESSVRPTIRTLLSTPFQEIRDLMHDFWQQ